MTIVNNPKLCISFALVLLAGGVSGKHASATTITLFALEDGTATDANFDGTFESLNTSDDTITLEARNIFSDQLESQVAMEFLLTSITPGSTVNSATLRVPSRSGAISGDGGNVTVSVHGYVGDGNIALDDFDKSNAIAGPLVAPSTIDVDVTAFVQGLVSNSDNFAGFNISADAFPSLGTFRRSWDSENAGPMAGPRLTVDISAVPEPTSFASLFLICLTVVVRRSRKDG